MVVYNYSGKEVNAKIVYYGPALSGKTTNLEWIYSKIPVEYSGKMVSLRTQADRTIFFDFLPLDLGVVDGFRTRFMLYTVPGQVHYNATRKMVLKGVDGLVFVADSEPGRMKDNIESLQNLRDNLLELGLDPDGLPLVIQWNKRDLPNSMPVAELETELNARGLPSFEACALTGEGVYETLHKVCRLIYGRLTGAAVAENGNGAENSLFGESIAHCLQDVDVPQPEPERVAVGVGAQSGPSSNPGADALGAILGRANGPESDRVGPSVEFSAPHDPPQGPPRPTGSSTRASAPPAAPSGPVVPPESVRPERGGPRPYEPEVQRLGGLVDEVLDALDAKDDLPSVDRAASRPVTSADSAPSPVVPMNSFDDLIAEDAGPASTRIVPPGRSGAVEGFAVEHDVDVFTQLSGTAQPVSSTTPPPGEPDPGDDLLDLDTVLGQIEDPQDRLDIIADPRRLPGESRAEAATGSAARSGASGFESRAGNTRILEVPVTVDASELEEGRQLRIVLNLQIRR